MTFASYFTKDIWLIKNMIKFLISRTSFIKYEENVMIYCLLVLFTMLLAQALDSLKYIRTV